MIKEQKSIRELREPRRRHPAHVVLDILLSGLPFKFPDEPYDYYYQDGVFGIRATRTDDTKAKLEEIILATDITLADFIKKCEGIPFEYIFIKGCEKLIRDFNMERS